MTRRARVRGFPSIVRTIVKLPWGSQRDTNIIWTYHVIIIKTVLRQYLALLYWAALISMFMNIIAWGLQVI